MNHLEKAMFIAKKKEDDRIKTRLDYIRQIEELNERIEKLARTNAFAKYEFEEVKSVMITVKCDAKTNVYGKPFVKIQVRKLNDSYEFNDITVYPNEKIDVSFGFNTIEAYKYFLEYFPKFEEYVYNKVDEEYAKINSVEE